MSFSTLDTAPTKGSHRFKSHEDLLGAIGIALLQRTALLAGDARGEHLRLGFLEEVVALLGSIQAGPLSHFSDGEYPTCPFYMETCGLSILINHWDAEWFMFSEVPVGGHCNIWPGGIEWDVDLHRREIAGKSSGYDVGVMFYASRNGPSL